MNVDDLLAGILRNNRAALGKAITLLESKRKDHRETALELINRCSPYSGKSIRIGISGSPGVGKSTFIDALGNFLLEKEKKIAVLAIDPSSKKSGGSILGDKTRMEKLASAENAFVRPSPNLGEPGGTGTATREAILLCEAAGYEIILIETVGVGQSETEVHSMTDLFILLTMAGTGDELQGIKRGIMEMADIFIINKSDMPGLKSQMTEFKSQITHALHMFPPADSHWKPMVIACSSLTGEGIELTWKMIEEYFTLIKKNRYFFTNRKQQLKHWFHSTLGREIIRQFFAEKEMQKRIKKAEKEVLGGTINAVSAARWVLSQ